MLTCLIGFMFFAMLIAGGLVLNLYLRSLGVVSKRHAHTPLGASLAALRQEAMTEEQFYMSLGMPGTEMDRYVRKGLICFLVVAFMFCFLLILFLNALF